MTNSYTWSPFKNTNTATDLDIELIKREVAQRFPFYDLRHNAKTAAFYCRIDQTVLGKKFDELRIALSKKGYIPMVRYEKGEHVIYVIKKPKVKKRPIWINIVLLIATFFTTSLAGSSLWAEFVTGEFYLFELNYLLEGFIYFSLPLMTILGIHEMGHYLASKKHKIDSSLPFFIPLPLFRLGTFGALISTREPIPDRNSLLDIGISGPICGFLIAIPVCFIGLFLTQQSTFIDTYFYEYPLLLQLISNLFEINREAVIHPTLFAGWVGLFLTAINLMPIGQLDGGHVSRALFKDRHKYVSWTVVISLMIFGWISFELYNSSMWLFFSIFVLFMIGTQHNPPLNEFSPLDTKRKILGIIAFVIFILCFAPIPFSA